MWTIIFMCRIRAEANKIFTQAICQRLYGKDYNAYYGDYIPSTPITLRHKTS